MKTWKWTLSLALLSICLFALSPSVTYSQDRETWESYTRVNARMPELAIGAELLWWKPCVDDMEFASKLAILDEDPFVSTIKSKKICPDWEPGVRVWLAIRDIWCDWGLSGSWTHINSDKTSTVKGSLSSSPPEIVFIALSSEDSGDTFLKVKGNWDTCYNEGEVLFFYSLCSNERHSFSPFFGAAGIALDQDLKIKGRNPEDDILSLKWESNYWGVGLRFGSNYEYVLCDCLRLFAKTSATLLAGELDSKINLFFDIMSEEAESVELTIKDDKCCHFVPGYHIGAGLVYDKCICNFGFSIRVGYDFVNWHNIPNPVKLGSGIWGASASTRTLGFHGPSAGLSIYF